MTGIETLCRLTINMPKLSFAGDPGDFFMPDWKIGPKFTPCQCFPYQCCNMVSIPEYDVSGMGGIYKNDHPEWGGNLQFFGGLKNVSGGYLNFAVSKKLTKASLLNILNKLEPVIPNNSIWYNGVIALNAESYVKLTEEEIQIATDKGWIVEYY